MVKRSSKWLSWSIGSVAVVGLSAYPLATLSAKADVTQHAPLRLEHNPRIHHALEALHDAKKELEEAKHDFHGKKQAAIDAVDHAIERLDEIKDWDE